MSSENTVTVEQFKRCMIKVQERVNSEIVRMNWGGCGVFAAELCAVMQEIGITDARIRVYGYDCEGTDLNELEQHLRENGIDVSDTCNWNDCGVNFGHIVVEWADRVWDSEICGDDISRNNQWCGNDMYSGYISYDALVELAANPSGWNFMYAREQNPHVRKIIREGFSTIH